MCKKVVILGAGGHAKVVADIILKSGDKVYGFLDDSLPRGTKIIDEYFVLGKLDDCLHLLKQDNDLLFIMAIGNNYSREIIDKKYKLNYYTAIDPNSTIGMNTVIGEGTVIQANSSIDPDVKIGRMCIIGKGAVVAHDNMLGDYIHVSPNATLCGTVSIGDFTHIGAGATVRNNISITQDCVIGAGAVVVKNIEDSGTYVGVPVKKIK